MSTHQNPQAKPRLFRFGLRASIMELFDIGPWIAISVLLGAVAIVVFGILFFIQSAPPSHITIASGPEDSMFHRTAVKYQKALEANGVKVHILTSNGSMENLDKITEKNTKIDMALVQSGIIDEDHDLSQIVSLGAIANQPVFFFYRGAVIDHLSAAQGLRMSIGHEGSGTRKIALKLLDLNGITEQETQGTTLLGLETDDAVKALFENKIDAAFIMSENVALSELRKLMRSSDIHLLNFRRHAAAYARKVDYLNVLDLPEGVIDFKQNIPSTNIALVGPMVELVTTKKLHPAISDLILDAAMTIHARPGLFHKRGEFPLAISQTIPLSNDADRFYKSGKSLFYRHLPFWLASLLSRIIFVFLPMIVVLIPLIKLVPWLFRLRYQMRIRRLYRALMQIESRFKNETESEKVSDLYKNFERIDNLVSNMRVHAAFADQFYHLRGHIDYVRKNMDKKE